MAVYLGLSAHLLPATCHPEPRSLQSQGFLLLFSMVFLIFVVVFSTWSQYIVHNSLELTAFLSAGLEASTVSFTSTLLFLTLTELNFCCGSPPPPITIDTCYNCLFSYRPLYCRPEFRAFQHGRILRSQHCASSSAQHSGHRKYFVVVFNPLENALQ